MSHVQFKKEALVALFYYTFICLYMFFNIYVLDTMQYFIYRNTSIWLVNYKVSLLLSILSELCNKHSDTYQQTVKQPVTTVLSFFYIYSRIIREKNIVGISVYNSCRPVINYVTGFTLIFHFT